MVLGAQTFSLDSRALARHLSPGVGALGGRAAMTRVGRWTAWRCCSSLRAGQLGSHRPRGPPASAQSDEDAQTQLFVKVLADAAFGGEQRTRAVPIFRQVGLDRPRVAAKAPKLVLLQTPSALIRRATLLSAYHFPLFISFFLPFTWQRWRTLVNVD